MRTLHTSYRVGDLERSVDFYLKLGFRELGRVPIRDESILVLMNLPGDGDVAMLELIYNHGVDSYEVGDGFSHLAISVDDIEASVAGLAEHGIRPDEPPFQPGEGSPWICFVRDPDGYRIELAQFPPGHPDGVTERDFQAS
jgi:lactoylglutathione lyase